MVIIGRIRFLHELCLPKHFIWVDFCIQEHYEPRAVTASLVLLLQLYLLLISHPAEILIGRIGILIAICESATGSFN